jgi:hypothetical protein
MTFLQEGVENGQQIQVHLSYYHFRTC